MNAYLINADLLQVHVSAVEELGSSVAVIQGAEGGPVTVVSLELVVAILASLKTSSELKVAVVKEDGKMGFLDQ